MRAVRNFQNPGAFDYQGLCRAQPYLLDRVSRHGPRHRHSARALRIRILRGDFCSAHGCAQSYRAAVSRQSLCDGHHGSHTHRGIEQAGKDLDRPFSPHRNLPHAGDRRVAHYRAGGLSAISAADLFRSRARRAGIGGVRRLALCAGFRIQRSSGARGRRVYVLPGLPILLSASTAAESIGRRGHRLPGFRPGPIVRSRLPAIVSRGSGDCGSGDPAARSQLVAIFPSAHRDHGIQPRPQLRARGRAVSHRAAVAR